MIIVIGSMPEVEQEAWNMGTATLKRFDSLLRQCSFYSQNGMLIQWKNTLMDLRRNLFPFMTEKQFDEIKIKFSELPSGWILPNGKINQSLFANVNMIFDEIYMAFVKIMKGKGLLMPKAIDSGKSVIEM